MPLSNTLNDDNLTVILSRFLLVSLHIDELQAARNTEGSIARSTVRLMIE
jgi:hypothetical protein